MFLLFTTWQAPQTKAGEDNQSLPVTSCTAPTLELSTEGILPEGSTEK